MKMSIRRLIVVLGALLSTLGLVLFFQNCAQTNFTSLPSNDPYGVDGGYGTGGTSGGTDPGYSMNRKVSLNVGSETVKNNVKLLLVVDDSYSMTSSRTKLANHATKLVESLKGKDVEIGITSIYYNPSSLKPKYYDSAGKEITKNAGKSVGAGDWSGYEGQSIKQVIEYAPPSLIPLNVSGVYRYYNYPDCSLTVNKYNYSCTRTGDARLTYIKSLEGKTVVAFAANMDATQQEILGIALQLTIQGIEPKTVQGEAYEKGLCVISSYLADKSSTAYLQPSTSGVANKIGVMIISDEDDYSGLVKDKCLQTREIKFSVQNNKERIYFGKFKSIIPHGGDATLAQRTLTYTYEMCKKETVTQEDIYCDGLKCGTRDIKNVEYDNALPCKAGWTSVRSSTQTLNFAVLEGGTINYGDACSSTAKSTGTGQIPGSVQGNNVQVGSCQVTTPTWYSEFNANDGRETNLYLPEEAQGNVNDLCNKSFSVGGVTYANALDYAYRALYGSPSYLTVVTGSCRYQESTSPSVQQQNAVTIDIIPANSDFGPAIANISKTKFSGGVSITSIINLDTSCGLVGSQSVGLQFMALSTYMGSNAKSVSICDNSYTGHIDGLVGSVTTIQKRFALALAANENVIGVVIINGSRTIPVPSVNYNYASGYLTVNSNDLAAGARIEVSIGVKKN